jgi:hypothetical protein
MLKTLQKSSISKRTFQVNKSWTVTNAEYPVISGSFTIDTTFDKETSNKQEGLYTYPLFKSLKSKYYNETGNPFTLHGRMENIGDSFERVTGTTGYVVSIPQKKYGEGIKPESLIMRDLTNDMVFGDDGYGNVSAVNPEYRLVSMDLENGTIIISDPDDGEFVGTLWSAPGATAVDFETGIVILTFGGDTDTINIMRVDLERGTLQTIVALDFEGLDIDELKYGNIIYSEGQVIFNDSIAPISDYSMNFKSTKTINELEVLVTAEAGQFNYSQSPSAVNVDLSGSYDTPITEVFNSIPAGTKKIKVVNDISQNKFYSGSFNQSISGSWDDYDASASIDPTGSYLAPYITTIGLYDTSGDMVAIAKLPQPIKNLPDYDMNFIVRLDT